MLITVGIIGCFVIWIFVPYAIRKIAVLGLRKLCRRRRSIVLTFDDGPGSTVTPKLLTLLAEYHASASFFALGRKIESDAKNCALILAGGHEIGAHSYGHLNAWKQSPLAVYRDIQRGLRLVGNLNTNVWFRPPHGKITLATMLQIWINKCHFAWWTIDSTDTWITPKPIEAILNDIRRQGGGVILLHDHDRSDNLVREAYVLSITSAILDMGRKDGFRLCKLSDIYDL